MDQTVSDRLRSEFHPQRLLPALMMGTVTGILEVIYALSIASLIFNGDLAAFLPRQLGGLADRYCTDQFGSRSV